MSENLVKDPNSNQTSSSLPKANKSKDLSLSDGEYDDRLALPLNGDGGDRQSSRHGSRRSKVRSHSGTKRNVSGMIHPRLNIL
jgi:hypothetical protein